MSRRHKDKGKIGGQFVPLLFSTLKSKAWRTSSPYARLIYTALKSRYSFDSKNNGRIYLSARTAAEETGFNRKTVARAFHGLVHYGFIVMTEPGCLGLNGRGKAPHWRLTELGYMDDPPTRDFQGWDGTVFQYQKKQNPVPSEGTGWPAGGDIPLARRTGQSTAKLARRRGHTDDPPCPVRGDISSSTTRGSESEKGVRSALLHSAVASTPSKTVHDDLVPRPPRTPEEQAKVDAQVGGARQQLGIPLRSNGSRRG
jgi:hypothetical protein